MTLQDVENLRRRWIDLYQRYRFLGFVPKQRLEDECRDHILWAKLGRNRQP